MTATGPAERVPAAERASAAKAVPQELVPEEGMPGEGMRAERIRHDEGAVRASRPGSAAGRVPDSPGEARAGGSVEGDGPVEGGRGTLFQRLRVAILAAIAALASWLPERPLLALAELGGELEYRLMPERAALVRRNLRRVALWLASESVGPPGARQAATDDHALERLVRGAFRQHARYYLELLRLRAMDARYIAERLVVEDPEAVEEALAERRPMIWVGLHFGAIELPSLYLVARTGRVSGPMETLADPALQRYIARSRAAVGVRLISIRETRRELVAALSRGEPVGLIADRDISGGGLPVRLFGAEARLPVGPALLAVETGAPIYVASCRRLPGGRYGGRLEQLPWPQDGSHRQRVAALVEAEARAMERIVADAPEQWWAVLFPIWRDLEAAS